MDAEIGGSTASIEPVIRLIAVIRELDQAFNDEAGERAQYLIDRCVLWLASGGRRVRRSVGRAKPFNHRQSPRTGVRLHCRDLLCRSRPGPGCSRTAGALLISLR